MPHERYRTLLLRLLALLGLFTLSTSAQVVVAPIQMTRMQIFNATGQPLANGCVNFFLAGTSTPQAIYADNTGTFQLANPLTLDSAGEASVWLSNVAYRIVANTGVVGQPCSSALGTQIWVEDNKNIFSIINNPQNLFLACGTSDPAGTNGELSCRSDLGKMRFFFGIWDSVVTEADVATLTNKTLNSPIIVTPTVTGGTFTTPSVGGVTVQNGPATYANITNEGATGTTINRLVKLTGAPSTGIITTAADIAGGAVGICVAGCGTIGSATIQMNGAVSCTVDPAGVTAGDYLQISPSTTGTCHDAGATYPTSGQVIGRALTTTGVGNASIDLFSAEIRPTAAPTVVTAVNTTGLAGNVASTPLLTPAVNGFYRASCYLVVTQAATTSSVLPQCQVTWNDADTNVGPETSNLTATVATNTVGTISIAGLGTLSFYAKSGVSISYQTGSFSSVGATPMIYALHLRLEGPF